MPEPKRIAIPQDTPEQDCQDKGKKQKALDKFKDRLGLALAAAGCATLVACSFDVSAMRASPTTDAGAEAQVIIDANDSEDTAPADDARDGGLDFDALDGDSGMDANAEDAMADSQPLQDAEQMDSLVADAQAEDSQQADAVQYDSQQTDAQQQSDSQQSDSQQSDSQQQADTKPHTWDPAWRACRTITSNKQGPDPIPSNYPKSVATDFQISNPGGIRFYKGTCDAMDNTSGPLDMWVESSDASGVKVWTHTVDPDVLQLAMLYDNPTAPDISDGRTVFPLFDTFSGTTLDASKWTCHGACAVAGDMLTMSGPPATYPYLESVQSFGTGVSFNARIAFEGTASHNFDAYAGFSTVPNARSIVWVYEGPSTKYAYEYNAFADDWGAKTVTDNSPHTWRIDRNSASAAFYYDGALADTLTNHYPTGGYPVIMNITQTGISMQVDWVYVRPKMEPDIINVVGPEQT